MLLVPLDADYGIPLRRAPDVRQACTEACGPADEPSSPRCASCSGLIGAHEWRNKGVEIPALGGRIHPHYGVFAPMRGEYVDLVAAAPLPAAMQRRLAFDIGTGTGVLAAVLARRGVARVDRHRPRSARARVRAREHRAPGAGATQVEVVQADLFPGRPRAAGRLQSAVDPGAAELAASSAAIYDPESRMLRGFLGGLAAHLEPGGEGWLILSDLAEHLGLRPRRSCWPHFAPRGCGWWIAVTYGRGTRASRTRPTPCMRRAPRR